MKFELKLKLDNDAFQNGNAPFEVARILKYLADQLDRNGSCDGLAFDLNGNNVGTVKYVFPKEGE